jgi:SAM-dependent methyltransferase
MRNPWFESRVNCPACISDGAKEIFRSHFTSPSIKGYLCNSYQGVIEWDYLAEAEFILCECGVCGLVYQRDIPNAVLMERIYEHWIASSDAKRRYTNVALCSYYAQEIAQIIAYLRKPPSDLRILDFGMGWGKWALMAKAFGCSSCGTELSPERIRHAKQNALETVEWSEIPSHQYDFINTEQVFEHIPEPLHTLRHLKSALKTGGLIKISVPAAPDIHRRLRVRDWKAPKDSRNSLNPVAPLEHVNLFRRTSLVAMAKRAGMDEVFIPMRLQYRFMSDWNGVGRIAKNILLPVYRNVLKKPNYAFFRNT